MRTNTNAAKNTANNTNAVAQQALLAAPAAVQASAPVALTVPVVTVAPAAMHTVPAPTSLRAKRIAAVQVGLHARYRAAKQAKHNAVSVHAKQHAYMQAVQALAAQMGVPVPNTLSVRNIATPQQHAPSNVQGACAVVRAWVHANPTATRKQAIAHFNGTVNPATVSTQYQRAKSGKA